MASVLAIQFLALLVKRQLNLYHFLCRQDLLFSQTKWLAIRSPANERDRADVINNYHKGRQISDRISRAIYFPDFCVHLHW